MEEFTEGEPEALSDHQPQPLTRTNITLHDTIWSRDMSPEPGPSASTARQPQHHQAAGSGGGAGWSSSRRGAGGCESDSDEHSYSSQDTMILRGAAAAAEDTTTAVHLLQAPAQDGDREADTQHSWHQQQQQRYSSPLRDSGASHREQSPLREDVHTGSSSSSRWQDLREPDSPASPKFILAKAPGLKQEPAASSHQHIERSPSPPSVDQPSVEYSAHHTQQDSLEEAREGSPEPQSYESRRLLSASSPPPVRPSPPRDQPPAMLHPGLNPLKEDEDKDDGYDSPGGQSSETSSTESNTNCAVAEKTGPSGPVPYKSILPKPNQKADAAKVPKVQKRVRFDMPEVVEEKPELEQEAEHQGQQGQKDKKKKGHSYLFELDVKIPSFKAMNALLRGGRKKEGSSSNSDKSSALEKQLQLLALGGSQEDGEDEVTKVSPVEVSNEDQGVYSLHGQSAAELCDSETGELRRSPSPPLYSSQPDMAPIDYSTSSSAYQVYNCQRNTHVNTTQHSALSHTVPQPSKKAQRRVHFAEPLISSVNDRVTVSEDHTQEVTYTIHKALTPDNPVSIKPQYHSGQSLPHTRENEPSASYTAVTSHDLRPHPGSAGQGVRGPGSDSGSSTSCHSLSGDPATESSAIHKEAQDSSLDGYINPGDSKAVLSLLSKMKESQARAGHSRNLLHSTTLPQAETASRLSKDDQHVRLRDSRQQQQQPPRPVSDYGFTGYSTGAESVQHTPQHPVSHPAMQQPPPPGPASDPSRPRFASSADIYGLLAKNRQNPFRPVPGMQHTAPAAEPQYAHPHGGTTQYPHAPQGNPAYQTYPGPQPGQASAAKSHHYEAMQPGVHQAPPPTAGNQSWPSMAPEPRYGNPPSHNAPPQGYPEQPELWTTKTYGDYAYSSL